MKNTSIWLEEKTSKNQLSSLKEDIEIDTLVIGGGITGLSCCYHLKDTGLKVALVEANRIGEGVTSRTTGKLTYMQENIYSKIYKEKSFATAMSYYNSQKDAINIVIDIIKKNKIDCDLQESNSFLFTENEVNKVIVENEKKLLKRLGVKSLTVEKLDFQSINSRYAIKARGCYVFHPLKYLKGLKKVLQKSNIKIYENTRIISIEKCHNHFVCKTLNNKIKAKKIVIATHYPYFLKPFFTPFKVSLEKSYISASPIEEKHTNFNAINIDIPSKSIRFHESCNNKYKIFLLGSRNIAEKLKDIAHFNNLIEKTNKIEYIWSNIDILTPDHLPYIGEISKNLYIATGYNTWGMTNGSIAGLIICDLIQNKNNKYSELFNPLRQLPLTKLLSIFTNNLKSYTKSIIFHKTLNNEAVLYTKNGIPLATVKGKDGKIHTVVSRCPHLRCNLIFNSTEETWDCPCHGSRFDIDGHCIDGPSNYDIVYEDE